MTGGEAERLKAITILGFQYIAVISHLYSIQEIQDNKVINVLEFELTKLAKEKELLEFKLNETIKKQKEENTDNANR